MSLLLHGGTVVSALDPPAIITGDVLVEDGTVAAIGPDAGSPSRPPRPAQAIDCTGCLVIPGNVNAHTHAYSALARGMPSRLAPPTDFVEILQRVWWRLDRALDPASIVASALVAGREALLAGTTTLLDHHASPNAIDGSLDLLADAFERLGIRSVLAYEATDRDGPERAAAGIAENARFARRLRDEPRRVTRAMVGAHASFTLSTVTLEACVDLARATRGGLHLHAAEDAVDEEDARVRFGSSVGVRLAEAGALTGRTLLAHCVHLDPDEAALVRAIGTVIVHNPRSNMHNGVGRAPLGWFGERVALGTDGLGSDLFEEARAAYLRRREEEPILSPDWSLARLAAGAHLAGDLFGEPLLGRIEAGAPADLVVLAPAAPTPLDAGNLAAHWVYGAGASAVRDVIVAGRLVVRERHLVTLDEAELLAGAREAARRLWERLAEIGPHPFAPAHRSLARIG